MKLALFSLLFVVQIAGATTINFDTLTDLSSIFQQYQAQGVTFTNAIALEAGLSLNDLLFPPRSGNVAAAPTNTSITLTFNGTTNFVSGYFTYASAVALQAYDAANTLVGQTNTPGNCTDNTIGSACGSPNLLLSLNTATAFSRVVISSADGMFALDDLNFTAPTATTSGSATLVPEPSFALLSAACLGLFLRRRR